MHGPEVPVPLGMNRKGARKPRAISQLGTLLEYVYKDYFHRKIIRRYSPSFPLAPASFSRTVSWCLTLCPLSTL
jgi:hypothetical protein